MTLEQWRSLHRGIGVATAVIVVFLCITGMLLNHAHILGLDRRHVQSGALLDWYGIGPGRSPVAFAAGDDWLVQIGDRFYFNAVELSGTGGRLAGATRHDGTVAVALGDRVLLLDEKGATLEVLRDVPQDIVAIGVSGGALMLRTSGGVYAGNPEAGTWIPAAPSGIEWSLPASTPPPLLQDLLEQYRGSGLTFERLLQDLHSGRILGTAGVLVMDAVALALLILVLSGTWMWWRRPRIPPD